MCVHEIADTLDGVAELPDTQTSLQTGVNATYWKVRELLELALAADARSRNLAHPLQVATDFAFTGLKPHDRKRGSQ